MTAPVPEPNAEMKIDIGGGRERAVPVHYPGNSRRAKKVPPGDDDQPKKSKVTRVTTGEVIQRKPPMFHRAIASLVGTESSQSVGEYLLLEVLIPAAKNMIVDTIEQAAQRFFYGDSRPRGSSQGVRPGYTSYNRIHSSAPLKPVPNISQRSRANHQFDEIVLETRGEAEDVIDGLRMLIDEYEFASVADLYDLVGTTGNFTDNQWGWYDLRTASVRHIRQGYLLVLPRTVQID